MVMEHAFDSALASSSALTLFVRAESSHLNWSKVLNTDKVERSIGTRRRECLDHVLIFGEAHLRRVLASYTAYNNRARTHLALQKDAPLRRAVQRRGHIVAESVLAGLSHQYVRM
jgi:hypothetical protein